MFSLCNELPKSFVLWSRHVCGWSSPVLAISCWKVPWEVPSWLLWCREQLDLPLTPFSKITIEYELLAFPEVEEKLLLYLISLVCRRPHPLSQSTRNQWRWPLQFFLDPFVIASRHKAWQDKTLHAPLGIWMYGLMSVVLRSVSYGTVDIDEND